MAKRLAPAVAPDRLTNVEATTDTVVEVMHRRYRDSSIEQLLVDPVSAIDMACEVAVELGDLKPLAARRIYEAVRKAMDENPGAQPSINRILRTALASRKRGDLRRDRY